MKPLTKENLLSLIAMIFQDKIDSDFVEKNNNTKVSFDGFVYNYFHSRYKIKKITKSHLESMLLSVQEHSSK